MAADYNKPVNTDDYADILEQLRDNIAAAQNMLDDLTGVTNIPTGALRYDQTAKKFQTYNGTTFVDTVLSEAGGGTGATSLGDYAFLSPADISAGPSVDIGGNPQSGYSTESDVILNRISPNVYVVHSRHEFTASDTGNIVVNLPIAAEVVCVGSGIMNINGTGATVKIVAEEGDSFLKVLNEDSTSFSVTSGEVVGLYASIMIFRRYL